MWRDGKTTAATASSADLGRAAVALGPLLSPFARIARHSWTTATVGSSGATCGPDRDEAGAVEGGDVVEEDRVGPLALEQQRREAPRPRLLRLHEDRHRREVLGLEPPDPLGRRDQDAERLDPVPPAAQAGTRRAASR